jgi:hypothetical protein
LFEEFSHDQEEEVLVLSDRECALLDGIFEFSDELLGGEGDEEADDGVVGVVDEFGVSGAVPDEGEEEEGLVGGGAHSRIFVCADEGEVEVLGGRRGCGYDDGGEEG